MGKKTDDENEGKMFSEKDIPKVDPPPGKTKICRPYITLKNGRRLFAAAYGKEAFCFYVDA